MFNFSFEQAESLRNDLLQLRLPTEEHHQLVYNHMSLCPMRSKIERLLLACFYLIKIQQANGIVIQISLSMPHFSAMGWFVIDKSLFLQVIHEE